jgi:hypothetical protein
MAVNWKQKNQSTVYNVSGNTMSMFSIYLAFNQQLYLWLCQWTIQLFTRLQSWALFDEISGAQMLENRSAGAQNSSQVRIKMQSRAQK